MQWLTRKVERFDAIGPKPLLWINSAAALLALIAHGGVLALARVGKAPQVAAAPNPYYISVGLALVVLAIGLMALAAPSQRQWVLKAHTLYFVYIFSGVVLSAVEVLIHGIPKGGSFSWNPVFVFFLFAYPVYLVRRTFIPPSLLPRPGIKYAHVIAGAVSILVSAIVLWLMFTAI